MKNLAQILEGIELSVEQYETKSLSLTADQSEIAKDISVNLFFLTDHKIEAFYKWNKAFIESKQKSDQKKEAEAHEQVPEYFKICQIQKAGENVLQILRTTISANK